MNFELLIDFMFYSDPFVIIELLPRRVFSHCTEQQTHVHKVIYSIKFPHQLYLIIDENFL
jgi:hypothetical protein